MNSWRKLPIRWVCISALGLLAVALIVWIQVLKNRPPPGMMKDIKAGLAARNIQDPDKRIHKYLEVRYGPLSDAANREKAFIDFFDVEHIRALQLLVKHSPENHRQANVDAMARWVASYREALTDAERSTLNSRFQTAEGQAMLRRATAQYNSQDVAYRGSTAQVISQLLQTLNTVEQSQ